MQKISRTISVVIFTVMIMPLALLAGPPPGAPTNQDPTAYQDLSQDEIARLKKGEIVIIKELSGDQDTARGMIKCAMIFNQPIDKTWELMTQGWRQEEYLPYLERTTKVKTFPDGNIVENQLKVFFVTLRFWVRGYQYDDRYYATWTLAEGYDNDMKRLEGFWQFYYLDDSHTLARYGTVTETGFGIPASVQEYLSKRDLPKSLGQVKIWVESGGTYRKPGYQPREK